MRPPSIGPTPPYMSLGTEHSAVSPKKGVDSAHTPDVCFPYYPLLQLPCHPPPIAQIRRAAPYLLQWRTDLVSVLVIR